MTAEIIGDSGKSYDYNVLFDAEDVINIYIE